MTLDLIIDVAWKSGLIAGLALLACALLRGRPAAERVVVLRVGAVLILALPLLSLALPRMTIETWSEPAAIQAPVAEAMGVAAPVAVEAHATPQAGAATPSPTIDPRVALPALYGLGVAALLGRLVIGVLALGRWTRNGRSVVDRTWTAALARVAPEGRRPLLKATRKAASPLSWGWRPAVVLVHPDTVARPEQAEAILAHEMAHVRRGDWLFLMLSRVLVAALWFNPLIWLLQRELSRQSERAADAWAVRRVPAVDYAQALVFLARSGPPHAALGITGGDSDLTGRVKAVLAGSTRGGRPWWTALAALACVGVATPLAAVDLVAATSPVRPVAGSAAPVPTEQAPSAARQTLATPVAPPGAAAAPPTRPEAPAASDPTVGVTRATGDVEIEHLASGAVRIIADSVSYSVLMPDGSQVTRPVVARLSDIPPPSAGAAGPPSPPNDDEIQEGVRQMRDGARQMDDGARTLDAVAAMGSRPDKAEKARLGAADLRRQAAEMRREADAVQREAEAVEREARAVAARADDGG